MVKALEVFAEARRKPAAGSARGGSTLDPAYS